MHELKEFIGSVLAGLLLVFIVSSFFAFVFGGLDALWEGSSQV